MTESNPTADRKDDGTVDQSAERKTSPDAFWAVADHDGDDYLSVLRLLHQYLEPKTYLEIGTLNGDSLRLAACSAIAIDPNFQIYQDIIGSKPACLVFQTTSDRFFSRHDPTKILEDRIDLAFLDGLHIFEYTLRDFVNLEKYAKQNSVIVIHDCIPTDAHVARRVIDDDTFLERSHHPEWWAGDVWKVVAALKKFRPDLKIQAFNAQPTGLAIVTNLDPTSKILSDNYFDIVKEFSRLDLGQYGIQRYLEELNIQNTGIMSSFESVAELFWL